MTIRMVKSSGCSCSCPLTGDLTSSVCVCRHAVNGTSTTVAISLAGQTSSLARETK